MFCTRFLMYRHSYHLNFFDSWKWDIVNGLVVYTTINLFDLNHTPTNPSNSVPFLSSFVLTAFISPTETTTIFWTPGSQSGTNQPGKL